MLFAGLATYIRYKDVHWTFANRLPAGNWLELVEQQQWLDDERIGAAAQAPVEEEVTNVWQLMGEEPGADASTAEPATNVSAQLGFHSSATAGKNERTYRKRMAYVQKYADLALQEQDKYGIPASITLAQGILESVCGESRLARENNNHFGIKCFSRRCARGHCSNFEDDHHKDFFRKYDNPRESYRAHSHLLRGKRYRHLFRLDPSDYRSWAYGLKKAGYATDKKYPEKLIRLIEELDLHRYDR
jgi:flagellum-specific peptidoglycan hydrolase FlgJ